MSKKARPTSTSSFPRHPPYLHFSYSSATSGATSFAECCELRAGIGQLHSCTRRAHNSSRCELRAGIGQLHFVARTVEKQTVVNCAQASVSYTEQDIYAMPSSVVNCAQASVSYTRCCTVSWFNAVVNCAQASVSYTQLGAQEIRSTRNSPHCKVHHLGKFVT